LLLFARNDGIVRIDRFLFFIRLVKSRTLAQAVIEAGYVRIDGKRVEKASEEVRVGSTIALPLHGQIRILRALSLPTRRGPPAEARACYEELTEANPRPSEVSEGAADQ
jgi:ribosome-associated heat shock protein Hsp15